MNPDPQLARVCLEASARAYSEAPTLEVADTQVLLIDRSEHLVIAVRGTTDVADWITDFDCPLVVRPLPGRVHAGFWRSANGVVEPIHRLLIKEIFPEIMVTGHSLGGAVAMMLAAMLGRRGWNVRAVYTFGQPRIGDHDFAVAYGQSALGSATWRYVNGADIVPRVPGILMGYRHAGTEVLLAEGEEPRVNPGLWTMARSDVGAWWREGRQGRIALLADHRIERYRENLIGTRGDAAIPAEVGK